MVLLIGLYIRHTHDLHNNNIQCSFNLIITRNVYIINIHLAILDIHQLNVRRVYILVIIYLSLESANV